MPKRNKAKSKAQQRFFGVVKSIQAGNMPLSKAKRSSKSKEAAKAATSMTPQEINKYARTKHKGLPEKVKQESLSSKQKYDLLCESLSILHEDVESYNELFYRKLEEYGVSSPDEMDEETKSRFFNELDDEWESKEERGNE